VILSKPQIIELHLHCRTEVSGPKDQRLPLARKHQEAEIDQTGNDKRPGEEEVPVESSREPAAQVGPLGNGRSIQGVRQRINVAARSEMGIRVVYLEPAGNHTNKK